MRAASRAVGSLGPSRRARAPSRRRVMARDAGVHGGTSRTPGGITLRQARGSRVVRAVCALRRGGQAANAGRQAGRSPTAGGEVIRGGALALTVASFVSVHAVVLRGMTCRTTRR